MTSTNDRAFANSAHPGEHPSMPSLLSIDEVAAYLRVSPRWVYTQVRAGRLRAMLIARSWRVRQEDVDDFADSFTVRV
jgi:excisionase family DNA binding protein